MRNPQKPDWFERREIRGAPSGGWVWWIFWVGMAALIVCAFLILGDRRISKEVIKTLWIVGGLACIMDHAPPTKLRLVLLPVTYLVTVLPGFLIGYLRNHQGESGIEAFFSMHAWGLWLGVCWLITPAVLSIAGHGHRLTAHGLTAMPRLWHATCLVAVAYAYWVMLACFASDTSEEAMRQFAYGVGIFTLLFLVLARAASHSMTMARIVPRAILAGWGVALMASAAVAFCYAALPDTRDFLAAKNFIRTDPAPVQGVWRLQFPFEQHNRLAYFAMLCGFCMAGAAIASSRTWLRVTFSGSAILAWSLIPMTMTRGALLAAGGGLAVFLVVLAVRQRRWLILMPLLALPFVPLLLSDQQKNYLAQIVNPANYQRNTSTTVGARLVLWAETKELIEVRPWFGYGYGFESFEAAFRKQYGEGYTELGGSSHAHNQILQTAVETGIPACILLIVFAGFRITLLAKAVRRLPARGSPLAVLAALWIAVEVSMLLYGLTNFPHRRVLGLLTFSIWACSMAISAWALVPQHVRGNPPTGRLSDAQTSA